MTDARSLLERHRPRLVSDSREACFADAAGVWTDAPTNVLKRADGTWRDPAAPTGARAAGSRRPPARPDGSASDGVKPT